MAAKSGMKHYPRELKDRGVQMCLEQGMPYSAITETLSIHEPGRVRVWLCSLCHEGVAAFTKPIGRPRKALGGASERKLSAIRKIKRQRLKRRQKHISSRGAMGCQFAYQLGLETALNHLRNLAAPETEMSPFDQSKYAPNARTGNKSNG